MFLILTDMVRRLASILFGTASTYYPRPINNILSLSASYGTSVLPTNIVLHCGMASLRKSILGVWFCRFLAPALVVLLFLDSSRWISSCPFRALLFSQHHHSAEVAHSILPRVTSFFFFVLDPNLRNVHPWYYFKLLEWRQVLPERRRNFASSACSPPCSLVLLDYGGMNQSILLCPSATAPRAKKMISGRRHLWRWNKSTERVLWLCITCGTIHEAIGGVLYSKSTLSQWYSMNSTTTYS